MLTLISDVRQLPDEPPYSDTKAMAKEFKDALERGGLSVAATRLWHGSAGRDYGLTCEVIVPGKKFPKGLRPFCALRGSWRKFRAKMWYVGLLDPRGAPFVACRSSGSNRTHTGPLLAAWLDSMADTLFLNAERYVLWAKVLKAKPCGTQDALVRLLLHKRRGRELYRMPLARLAAVHGEYEKSDRGKTAWNLIMAFGREAAVLDSASTRLHTLDQCWEFTRGYLEEFYDKGISA